MFWKSAIDLALCGLDQVDLIILVIFTWTQVDKLNDSMLERSIRSLVCEFLLCFN